MSPDIDPPDDAPPDLEARLRRDLPLAADALLTDDGLAFGQPPGFRFPRRPAYAIGAIAAVLVLVAAGVVGWRDSHRDQVVTAGAPSTSTPQSASTSLPAIRPGAAVAGGCPAANFTVGSASALAALDLAPAPAATDGSYRNLGVGDEAVVATNRGSGRAASSGSPAGELVLVRGVSDNEFAVSLYSHGPAPLRNVTVLGSDATLYPAADLTSGALPGAVGMSRVVFADAPDRVDDACSRWDLRAQGLTDDQLSGYAAALTAVAASPGAGTVPAGHTTPVTPATPPVTTGDATTPPATGVPVTTAPVTPPTEPADQLSSLDPSLHAFAARLLHGTAAVAQANLSPIVDDPSVGVIAAISSNVRSVGTHPQVDIVVQHPSGWSVLAQMALDVGGVVQPGTTSITVAHLTGAATTDFVVTASYNSGLATAIITNLTNAGGTWQPVDFVVGTGVPHDEVLGATLGATSVTDTENTCVPDCARGTTFHRTYIFDPARRELVAPA